MEKDYKLKTTYKDVLLYFRNMFLASALLALVQSIGYSGFVESNSDLLVDFESSFGFEFNYFVFLLAGIVGTFLVVLIIDLLISTVIFFCAMIFGLVGSGVMRLHKVYKKRESN